MPFSKYFFNPVLPIWILWSGICNIRLLGLLTDSLYSMIWYWNIPLCWVGLPPEKTPNHTYSLWLRREKSDTLTDTSMVRRKSSFPLNVCGPHALHTRKLESSHSEQLWCQRRYTLIFIISIYRARARECLTHAFRFMWKNKPSTNYFHRFHVELAGASRYKNYNTVQ